MTMTTDGDALFRAICEQPWEDTPRLVYADWLEENGQPERAEFIRFQCEFPKWDSSHPRFQELMAKEKRFEPYFRDWMKSLPRAKGIKWWERFWGRGFIDCITVASAKAFVENADAIFAASPIELLEVKMITGGTIGRVLCSEYLKRLRQLALLGSLGFSAVRAISVCANLVNLESLCVWGSCPDEGAVQLAASPYLGRLTSLSFSGHSLTDDGVNALIDSEQLRSVTRLVLHGTRGLGKRTVSRIKKRFESFD